MGKSSFIQALLTLKQSDLGKGRLEPNDGLYVKLGSTKDVLYQYSKKENLGLAMQFSSGEMFSFQYKYEIEADYFLSILNDDENKIKEFIYSHFIEIIFKESLFSNNFQYLNANRFGPNSLNPKSFGNIVNRKNLGNNGEYTAHYIEVYNGDEVEFQNLVHPSSKSIDNVTGKEIVNKTLIHQINLWMGEISPDINIRTTSISNDYVMLEYVYKQPNFGNTNRFKPENVGFGISYALPVVVALLAARPGELIIIENPESHIHPRGQAELGKLIALVAMNDVQVIIETHSDHILNGIRVAVKEKAIEKDKVAIFYFEKEVAADEQYSKITDIEINSNGELSAYPPDMLDEWSNQLFKLL